MSPHMSFVLTSFRASFFHSCGRFVDHGGHGGRFFWTGDVVMLCLP